MIWIDGTDLGSIENTGSMTASSTHRTGRELNDLNSITEAEVAAMW